MQKILNFFSALLVLVNISCKKPAKHIEKDGMVWIEGNSDIADFWIDISPVTVGQFEQFINATNYKTQAETFGDAGYFDFKTGIWSLKKGAYWKYPLGSDTTAAPLDHPVTQVSWNDVQAYCQWAKKRLPTSEEFVFAEKNGSNDYEEVYTWGHDFIENGKYKANFWQGIFPYNNTVEDGFLTTSPVGYFGKNKIGLTDMGGNVWQWCSDASKDKPDEMNQRGGSYLCDPMVCHGFKIGGISSSSAETALMHVGFRCVKDGK